jgi:DNA polymerase (family 10)
MLASTVIREARRAGLAVDALTPVGSVRRYAPDIGDVALLATAPARDHARILKDFSRLPIVSEVTAQAPASVTTETARGGVTLHLATPEDAGAALVWHTGSRRHVERLQQRAGRLGLSLADSRLTRDGSAPVTSPTEQEVYGLLELPYIPPELRDGGDEIGAAERGELPYLVSELHIRGDLHMHSTWSDGRNSIADMVGASRQLGYEYLAITDHSERAMSSRSLAAADVHKQKEEIEELRARVRGIEILHGIEVDILHDGSLDFADDVLEGFDLVLASLHDHGGHDARVLMERYLRAIRHPLVNVITHPANRSPGFSDGYALDFDTLFAAAAETGTALEIDGAPGHLDLDGAMARRAAAAGVTLVIDSDCHRMDALGRQMQFAVGTARRGWIEPQHVLNTRSVGDVRAFVANKRSRA